MPSFNINLIDNREKTRKKKSCAPISHHLLLWLISCSLERVMGEERGDICHGLFSSCYSRGTVCAYICVCVVCVVYIVCVYVACVVCMCRGVWW